MEDCLEPGAVLFLLNKNIAEDQGKSNNCGSVFGEYRLGNAGQLRTEPHNSLPKILDCRTMEVELINYVVYSGEPVAHACSDVYQVERVG